MKIKLTTAIAVIILICVFVLIAVPCVIRVIILNNMPPPKDAPYIIRSFSYAPEDNTSVPRNILSEDRLLITDGIITLSNTGMVVETGGYWYLDGLEWRHVYEAAKIEAKFKDINDPQRIEINMR